MICKRCNSTIPDNSVFCSACGVRIEEGSSFNSESAFKIAGDLLDDTIESPAVHQEQNPVVVSVSSNEARLLSEKLLNEDSAYTLENSIDKPSGRINYIALVLVLTCAIVWLTAPFMAVNYYTFGDQPTALELLQDEVTYIGELSESAAYKAAVISIIGIVLCLVCILCKSRIVTRLVATAILIPLTKTIIDVIRWADDFEEFTEFFGAAYWCIVVGLLFIAFLGGRMRKAN